MDETDWPVVRDRLCSIFLGDQDDVCFVDQVEVLAASHVKIVDSCDNGTPASFEEIAHVVIRPWRFIARKLSDSYEYFQLSERIIQGGGVHRGEA